MFTRLKLKLRMARRLGACNRETPFLFSLLHPRSPRERRPKAVADMAPTPSRSGNPLCHLHETPLAFWEIVKLGGVVDKDTVPHCLVQRPIEHQIDQDRIVWLGFRISHPRVWPVAAPDQPLGCCLNIGAGDRARVGIGWRPDFGVSISTGQFDPGPA